MLHERSVIPKYASDTGSSDSVTSSFEALAKVLPPQSSEPSRSRRVRDFRSATCILGCICQLRVV